MSILAVNGLRKSYPGFTLRDISFSLQEGAITGFIGRNGAGKTTTLKSLLNFVHPDQGEVEFFGQRFSGHELAIKEKIGFVSGAADFYPRQKLATITSVTRRFYPHWDEAAYRRYLQMFDLDESKTPAQLSAGMKVKYALALALSHRAELLILDEPTSGLDPVSRDDLLDVFLDLTEQQELTILFSTHITSDLEKCADHILYIQEGRLLADSGLEAFRASYRLVKLTEADRQRCPREQLIGCKRSKSGYTALVPAAAPPLPGLETSGADLDAIMVHLDKEAQRHD